MTNDQLKAIHIYRRDLEKLNADVFGRAWFDLVLINVGGVRADNDGKISSKSLSNSSFERVMAFMEDTLAKHRDGVASYWRDQVRRHGHFLTTRQEWQIHKLYAEMRAAGLTYSLESVVDQMSGRRTQAASQLNPHEAFKVIEMLKAAVERQKA